MNQVLVHRVNALLEQKIILSWSFKAALTLIIFLSIFALDLAFSLKTKTICKNAKLVKMVTNINMQMIMIFFPSTL